MWNVSPTLPALRSPYLLPQSVHSRRGVSDQKGRERRREEGERKEGGREEGGGGGEAEGKGEGAHCFLSLLLQRQHEIFCIVQHLKANKLVKGES